MFFSVSKFPTITEIQDLYKQNKATVLDVYNFFLNRSKQVDKQITAIYKYSEEIGENQAKELDKVLEDFKKKEGENYFENLIKEYPLFGIPYFVKAIILVEGEILNGGTKVLDGFKAPYSSTVYNKIKKAGAVLLGICNMDELATGASGESSAYGITKNPYDTSRIPGGSSSGSAASVASGQCVFSLGTDTGGSIRQPAAFCNVVGIKTTYGLVSRFGVMPMTSGFDQVGPITNTIEDNLIVTKILAGKDENDQTSIDSRELDERLERVLENRKNQRKTKKMVETTKSLRIGFPKEFYIDGIDPIISKALETLKQNLKDIGHKIVDISIPLAKYSIPVYYITMPVELAANLERLDGVRYALQDQNLDSEMYYKQRSFFGDEVKRRIMLGTYVSSAGYYDAYYNQAQKVREMARLSFMEAFEKCDVLLTPTTPEFPFKLGEKTSDPLKMYLSDVFTSGVNPVRIPGLNVPLGLFEVETENGKVELPTGCQLLGPELSEDLLYTLGQEIEQIVADKE